MKLSEIFDALTYGELSQISLGGAEQGQIDERNHKQVISHINLGLTDLHTRFVLKEGRATVTFQPGIQTYALAQPDLLKVERVLAAAGWEMGLNDASDPYSCFTPSMNLLRVAPAVVAQGQDLPDELKTPSLEVVYRASHPQIVADEWGVPDPSTVTVELPYSHLQALLYFVASRVHTPGGASAGFHAGNDYLGKYEAACLQLEQANIRTDQGSQSDRLRRNGWV